MSFPLPNCFLGGGSATGIIGSADGPTAIYVTFSTGDIVLLALGALALVAVVVGLVVFVCKKCRSKK